MKSFLLTDDNDLSISDTTLNLTFTEQNSYILQKIKNRLLFIRNEWFLDRSLGLPYFDVILEKGVDFNFIVLLFRQEILNINGITDIIEFNVELTGDRSFNIEFKVLYNSEEVEGEVST
jgi:hypothetical protein